MPKKKSNIVVAGDVTIDWLQWNVKPKEESGIGRKTVPNWELYKGIRMAAKPGGVLLLASLVEAATGAKVITHELKDIENIPPEKVINSTTLLKECPYSSKKEHEKTMVYRVDRFCGFSGPEDGVIEPIPVTGDDPNAGIVILDDAGNGFRDKKSSWPKAIKQEGHNPIVVLKMSRPLAQGKLWETVNRKHAGNLIVVINANDLRDCGVNISRRLSWERTAQDFVWQMANNSTIRPLAGCNNLVVRFGIDGAIHYTRCDGNVKVRLYYDPKVIEDGYIDISPGEMQGLASTFVAALVVRLTKEGLPGIGEGVRDGINGSRRIFRQGFGRPPAEPDYPRSEIFKAKDKEDVLIADVLIPDSEASDGDAQSYWTILKQLTQAGLEEVAYNTVLKGADPIFDRVPVGRFGKLTTVDRTEIESYHTIKNLMVEYLDKEDAKVPLCIAVFGPPGSGKSFGVKQLAETVGSGKVKDIDFNVSQFESIDDLISALNKVQSMVLEGVVPIVFFDEFDSKFEGGELGWLKYFLAPMQDGKFKHGEMMYPIGKSIFVFAGGTSHNFREFCREDLEGETSEMVRKAFRDTKGPDFLSRLRGYVNIMGPNKANEDDIFFPIRRAMLLRSLLEREAKHLFDRSENLRIDNGVMRAFINVPAYKHGVRSIVAIIEMSMLAGRRSFEQAALPPKRQLEMHVDADLFTRWVLRDVLFGDALDDLAKAIHEQYCKDMKGKRPKDAPVMQPWEKLTEEYKESNRLQADQIPEKLQTVGFGFSPTVGKKAVDFKFSTGEVEALAKMEHERFVVERRRMGWTLGEPRDDPKKIHPSLMPWEELPEKEKEKNRQMVSRIPEYLSSAGFEIYTL